MGKWHRVSDVLPQYEVRVIVWDQDEPLEPGHTDELEKKIETKDGVYYKWRRDSQPSHW